MVSFPRWRLCFKILKMQKHQQLLCTVTYEKLAYQQPTYKTCSCKRGFNSSVNIAPNSYLSLNFESSLIKTYLSSIPFNLSHALSIFVINPLLRIDQKEKIAPKIAVNKLRFRLVFIITAYGLVHKIFLLLSQARPQLSVFWILLCVRHPRMP